MKLSFKYLIFMFILLLMPICNVRAFSYSGNYNESLIDTAKSDSNVFFIRKKLYFKTDDVCQLSIRSSMNEGFWKNNVVTAYSYGGYVIYLGKNALNAILDGNVDTDLEINLSCRDAARSINKNAVGDYDYYNVSITFNKIHFQVPDNSTIKSNIRNSAKGLIILADSVLAGDNSDEPEHPIGLGFVSKLIDKNNNVLENGVSFEGKDYGIGVGMTTTIKLSSKTSQNVAFLFKDLDRPDVSSVDYNGSFDFGGGAQFTESIALNRKVGEDHNGFSNIVHYSRQAQFSFLNAKNGAWEENCNNLIANGGILQCVVKPTLASDNNNFLIFAKMDETNVISFNWCGSNAHTAIGFLYFPEDPEEDSPPDSTLIEHICSNSNDTNFINSVGCHDNTLMDGTQRSNNGSAVTVTHSSCRLDNRIHVYLYGVYIRSEVERYPQNDNGTMGAGTKCEKVDLQFPIVLLENIEFNVNGLYYTDGNRNLNKIYAGGGFSWNGASLNNNISYVYRYYKNDSYYVNDSSSEGNFLYIIHHKYSQLNKDGSYSPLKKSFAYFHDNIEIYKDSSCSNSNKYETKLNDYVASQIESRISYQERLLVNSGNSSIAHFKSVNPNNASIKNEPLRVMDNFLSGGNVYNESISLNQSWINPKTAEISFSSNGGNYIDGGNKWYVPLKYMDSTVTVSASNLNISRIRNLKVSVSCPIDVEHILYEPDGNGGLKLAYRYRPIKLNNVFNGKAKNEIAQNWQDWYCGNDADCDGGNDNKTRLEETYEKYRANNPLYRIILNDSNGSDIRAFNNNNSYISFNNFNTGNPASGTSSFVSKYFNGGNGNILKAVPDTHYCGLGVFVPGKDGCNQRW